jgi:hypothetical protein
MRRKGERKLEKSWQPWGPKHPVHHMITGGDGWFLAWQTQAATSYPTITRKTGITAQRLGEIEYGEPISRAEIDALASLWNAPVGDLIESLPGSMYGDGVWQ